MSVNNNNYEYTSTTDGQQKQLIITTKQCLFLRLFHDGFVVRELLTQLKESVYRMNANDTRKYVLMSWTRQCDVSKTKTYSSDWKLLFIFAFVCFPELRDTVKSETNELSWFMAYGYLLSRVNSFLLSWIVEPDQVDAWLDDCLYPLAYPCATALFSATNEVLMAQTLASTMLKDWGQFDGMATVPTHHEWLSLKSTNN